MDCFKAGKAGTYPIRLIQFINTLMFCNLSFTEVTILCVVLCFKLLQDMIRLILRYCFVRVIR